MLTFATLLLAGVGVAWQPTISVEALRRSFASPPDDARIMMRWWWFGSAVAQPELRRELEAMKSAGIGGVEIQPVYPLVLDDPTHGIRNLPYLSPQFLEAVRFASQTARELGLRVDITLGSGWPFGGPHTTADQAAGSLRYQEIPVPEGASSVPLPSISQGEQLLAVFLGGRQTTDIQNNRVQIPAGLSGPDLLRVFIASRTGQQVKRSAVGAEGFVLDHYDRQRSNTILLRGRTADCEPSVIIRHTRYSATAWKFMAPIGPTISFRVPEAPRIRSDSLFARPGARQRPQHPRVPA